MGITKDLEGTSLIHDGHLPKIQYHMSFLGTQCIVVVESGRLSREISQSAHKLGRILTDIKKIVKKNNNNNPRRPKLPFYIQKYEYRPSFYIHDFLGEIDVCPVSYPSFFEFHNK